MLRVVAVLGIVICSCAPALAATPAEILDANHAASSGEAWAGKAALTTRFDYAGQGLTGTASGTTDLRDGRFAQFAVTGPRTFGRGFDGAHSWIQDNSGVVTLQDGANARELAVNAAYRNANLWWKASRAGAAIALKGTVRESRRTFDVLTVAPKGGEPFEAWFDARTHLLARVKEYYAEAMFTTTYDDYRASDGALLSFTITVGSGDSTYDQHYTLTKATFLSASDPADYAPPKSRELDYTISGGSHQTTIPFILNNNHTQANVTIDGKGPFSFLFDTGAQNLVSADVAGRIGLVVQGRSQMRGAGEGSTDFGFSTLHNVRIGGITVRDQLYGVIPLHGVYPSNGLEMQGMIGSDTFRHFVTRIDYIAKTFTFIDPKYFDPAGAGIPIKVAFNYNEVVVDGSFDGIPGKFQIDSGARMSLTLNTPFATTNGLLAKYDKGVDAVDGWGLGGPSHGHVSRGGILNLGGVALKNLVFAIGTDKAGAFADASKAGLIGGGVLKRYIVTLDYGHAVMFLKPVSGPVPDLDSYDRAGTWFNAGTNGYDVVSVNADGPAARAGLKIGDVIAKIDDKPVLNADLSDVRMRLRNDPPGTIVALSISRGGVAKELEVTLRDQI